MPEQPRTGNQPRELRQCGRCRLSFPTDPTLHPVALREWWLCPSCYDTLLGPAGLPTVKREQPLRTTS
jgi:hypothetical protein